MYSHEIEELLKLRNNIVTLREYLLICQSPQVDHIKYENDEFHLWTSDGYSFVLRIRKERYV